MRVFFIFLMLFNVCLSSEIKWFSYEEGIKKAKSEKKLILLDIYAQWCHWCNVMENTTYRDQNVVSLITQHFIPIRVDAEKRPDLNKKYNQGGLPTTVIMDSKGNILWGGIYVSPEDMERLLSYFLSLDEKQIKKIAQLNKKKEERAYKRFFKKIKPKEPSKKYIKKVFRSIKIRFDSENGGFYGAPKFPQEELLHFLLLYWKFVGDKEAKKMMIKTAQGYMRLIDPVEGGIYRYSVNQYWTQPHYEKLLKDQSDLSSTFFDIYSQTGDNRFLRSALSLVNFSINKLYDRNRKLFYNSQGADIVDQEGTILMTGEEFFKLSREERKKAVKKLGYPPKLEKSFYYGNNALISKALFYAYIFTGEKKYLNTAKDVLDTVLEKAFSEKGIIYSENGGYYLSENIYTLEALITAYQITGDREYLKKSIDLLGILQRYYYSKKLGILTDPEDTGISLKRISFIDDIILLNARAVKSIYTLSVIAGDKNYQNFADSIIRHLPTNVNISTGIGFFVYLYPPVVVHINEKNKNADLVRKILRVFPYWISIHFDRSEEGYFICNSQLCFFKTDNPEQVPDLLKKAVESYKNM